MSALHDRYGLPLSTTSAVAAERYVDAVDRLLSFNLGAEAAFNEALAADEGFALAQADLAYTFQVRGSVEEAKAAAARARELAAGCSRRERQHVEAIATAVDGEGARGLGLIREHLAEFPRDVLLVYLASSLIGYSGRAGWPEERLALFDALAPHYGEDWWFLGYHSFVHQEVDHFEQARALGERSLALYPTNAGATHSLAHVFYETDDHSGGRTFLDGWIASYDQRAPYHCHLSWHLALFELAVGRFGRVMELYERFISPPLVVQSRTMLPDSSALLWRCQMFGCSRGLPWKEVRELAARVAARPGMSFADAHAALAYAGAGDEAAMSGLIDGLRELEARGHPLAGMVVLPLVLGIRAFAEGTYEETIRLVEPVFDQIVRIGGSEAQREVFEDTLLQAYLRVGRYEPAERLLRQRLDRQPAPRDLLWLGQAQAGLGQTEQAVASLSEAERRWQGADPNFPQLAAARKSLATGAA